MAALDRGRVKTRAAPKFRGPPALAYIEIVDPGAICEVDILREHSDGEFSHSLDPKQPSHLGEIRALRSFLKRTKRSRARTVRPPKDEQLDCRTDVR